MAVIDRQSAVKSSVEGVEGDDKWGVTVLEISYGREFSAGPDESSELSQELISGYDSRRGGKSKQEPAQESSPPPPEKEQEKGQDKATSPSCVIVLDTRTAGSPLLKALRNIHSHVSAHKGILSVVGFPTRFIALLNSLGLPSYEDFRLSRDKANAVAEIRSSEATKREGPSQPKS